MRKYEAGGRSLVRLLQNPSFATGNMGIAARVIRLSMVEGQAREVLSGFYQVR